MQNKTYIPRPSTVHQGKTAPIQWPDQNAATKTLSGNESKSKFSERKIKEWVNY